MKDNESIRKDRPENLMALTPEVQRQRAEMSRRRVVRHAEGEKESREKSIVSGLQELAIAVIMQAWIDAQYWKDGYNRRMARNFLTGSSKEWRESLENWCGVCGKDPRGILDKARGQFWEKTKIEQYRRYGR